MFKLGSVDIKRTCWIFQSFIPSLYFVCRLLIAYKNMICAVENFSIATVYGLYYFGRGNLGTGSFSMFVRYDSLAQNYFTATQHFSLIIYEEYQRFQLNFTPFDNMTLRYLTKMHKRTNCFQCRHVSRCISSICKQNPFLLFCSHYITHLFILLHSFYRQNNSSLAAAPLCL